MVNPRSPTCRVAFKEWAGVCDALIDGRQALVIRKGGISERPGPGGFVPEHPEFWLYPTWSHQAEQGLRSHTGVSPAPHRAAFDGTVPIQALVRVELVGYVEREETLASLESFHVFNSETVWKRFHYRRPGLWALGARVWRRDQALALTPTPEHTGCKTWVFLDEPLPTAGLTPVLDDDEWCRRRDRLESVLDLEKRSDRA